MVRIAGAVVIAAVALFALHRLASWMEAQGWLYYRRKQPSSSALGNAFLEVQSLLEPSKRQVLEVRRQQRVEPSDPGDPPDAGDQGAGSSRRGPSG